jgi:SNF2 family DNA or RNA helicase
MTGHMAAALVEAGVNVDADAYAMARAFLEAERALHGVFSVEATNHPASTPFGHQRAAIAAIQHGDAVFLAHEMGTGKTFSCIAALDGLDARRVLVLAPLSVVPVWGREVERRGAVSRWVESLDRGSVATKTARARNALTLNTPVMVVCNYESAWRAPLAKLLLDTEWDAVICDESHRLKDHRGKASQFAKKLGLRARKRICLTGTPMPNSPLDLFGQMQFLEPSVFGVNYYEHRSRYAVMGGYNQHQVVAYRDLSDLFARWERLAHRVASADVLDLPDATHMQIEVGLGREASALYRELSGSLQASVASGTVTVGNALTELLRLQQVTGGAVTLDGGESAVVDTAKGDALRDLLEGLPATEPVVVFARFRADLDAIHRAAASAGRESTELSGRVNGLDAWQRGGCPVIAVQIQAGGLGVDLSRARYCVYYSLGYSLGDYQQSVARIHRQGQTRPCFYYHLLARLDDGEETVDGAVYRAIKKKKKIVDAVFSMFYSDLR